MSGSNPGRAQRSYEITNNASSSRSLFSRPASAKTNRLMWSLVALISIVIIIVVILLIVVLVYYEGGKLPFANGSAHNTSSTSPYISTTTYPAPDADKTIRLLLASSMNTSADPKSNFYQYACGNWKTGKDLVTIQQNKIYLSLSNLQSNISLNDSGVEVYQKLLSKSYVSCTTHAGLEDNIDQVRNYVNNLGPWPMTATTRQTQSVYASFWQLAGKLAGQTLVQALLTITPGVYTTDGKIMDALYIDQATLGLPLADFDPTNPLSIKKQNNYRNTITQAAKKIAEATSIDNLEQHVHAMVNFEKELYTILNPTSNEQLMNPIAYYNISELSAMYPKIKWYDYFGEFQNMNSSNLTITPVMFVVRSPNFLSSLPAVTSTYGEPTLMNYLIWRFVQTKLNFLDLPGNIARENEQQNIIDCAKFLSQYLPDATSSIYMKSFPINDTVITLAKKTLDRIQFNILEHTSNTDWFKNDAVSYNNVKNKLLSMKILIGIQPASDAALNIEYADLADAVSEDFPWFTVSNLITEHYSKFLWTSSESPSRFAVDSVLPNYYYDTNTLLVPNAFIASPFIAPQFDTAWNLGLFGSIVGREMLKAIDTIGIEYSVNTTTNAVLLQPLLNPLAKTKFENMLNCLANQYTNLCSSNHTGSVYCINGNKTINSNLLDNTGLDASYIRDVIEPEQGLHSFDIPQLNITITSQQLFFISMAQAYCTNVDDTTSNEQILESNTPPNYLRLQGITQNSIGFKNAFSMSNNLVCKIL